MAGAGSRLRPGNARPDENDAADRRAFLRVELRRNRRRSLVNLDAFDVLRDDVVDVQREGLYTIDPVLGRTITATHLGAVEAQCGLTAISHRNETRARNHAHHVAQVHRVSLLDLVARHEVAKAARAAIVEVGENLPSPRRLLD